MLQQRGRRDGDGLVAGREHGPTVATAFGYKERIAGFQQVEHGQVVDAALGALRKLIQIRFLL